MSVNQKSRFGRDEQVASVIGSLVGGLLAGVLIQLTGGAEAMLYFAWMIDASTVATGWVVWMVLSLLFGIGFALFVSRNINTFTNTIIMVSRKSTVTQELLVPLLHRSALGLTAGSMGLIYGQILGFGFFAYLVPVILGMNGYFVNFPLAIFPVIFGYITYATVLGTVYGMLLEADWYELGGGDAAEQSAALVGAVAGGLLGSGVLYLVGGAESLATLGTLVNGASVPHGLLVFMLAALVLGLAFSWVLSRTINDFTNTVIMFSRRSEATQKVLVPLITRAALTVTAGSMGLVYGLVIGVAAVVLGVVGVVPQTGLAGVLAFAVYGSVLGNGYGLMMEKVDLSGLGPSEESRAGIKGSLGAGLLSGLFVFAFVGVSVFTGLASVVGQGGIFTGFLVWMAISVALGLAFVAYVSRSINDFTNTVIMFSQRSEATQKILVPLITRAALTVTAGSMGLVYGLVLGVAVFGGSVAGLLPSVSPLIVLAFVIYGQALGTSYGLILEDADLSLPTVFGGDEADEDEMPAEGDKEEFVPPHERPGFAGWRARRPFAGSVMLMLAGLIILAIPLRLQFIFPGPSKAALGIVFGAMVIACGVFALLKPGLSTLIGVTGIAMSILSLVGAFGGLVVGMLVGIVGGNLCIAWQHPARDEEAASDSRFNWTGEGEQQQW
ncbi:DUF6114 domain-containing protein [Halorientalis salina]|uniref:DUF6114 domain-containing protein n=1 Tax=Halorientalis salina TaxID=2932266 RepID=UPI0010AC81F8|nr:DUF6114 domain-containing protein [Halorientalis salina]